MILISGLCPVRAASATHDEFLGAFMQRLQASLPGYRLTPAGDLSISIVQPNGVKFGELQLKDVYDECSGNAGDCPAAAGYLRTAADTAEVRNLPIDATRVRLVVRSTREIEQVIAQRTSSAPALVLQPFAADVVFALVLHDPRWSRYLDLSDAQTTQLTSKALLELGQKNSEALVLPATADLPVPSDAEPIRFINTTPYECVRLLRLEDWAAMRRFATVAMPSAQRPVSPAVFRWTRDGWQVIPE